MQFFFICSINQHSGEPQNEVAENEMSFAVLRDKLDAISCGAVAVWETNLQFLSLARFMCTLASTINTRRQSD